MITNSSKALRHAFLLVCWLGFFNPATAFANDTAPGILVLGDSLSAAYGIDANEGWVALLQKRLDREGYWYRVVNASVSGDTTRTGLGRLESALENHRPAIVIVALGGNDGLRGLPFSEIEQSLTGIIETSKRYQANVLLAGVRLPPNYGPFYNLKFAGLFRKLAKQYETALVPKILDQVADDPTLMQVDRIHPTAEAQPRILANIWAGLEALLERS